MPIEPSNAYRPDLVILVPSRGRPEALRAMAKVYEDTCRGNTALVFVVDQSDPWLEHYSAALSEVNASWVERAYGSGGSFFPTVALAVAENKPGTMVGALNEAAVFTAGREDAPYAIGFQGDDHRPRTDGWDVAYLKALNGLGSGIVFGDDGLQHGALATQCAMTSDIVKALGYMAPPMLRHLYVDNFWTDLGREVGVLEYLPDVLIEHMHPVAGKAEMDEGYERVNAPAVHEADRLAYQGFVYDGGLFQAAEKVRDLLAGVGREVHEWRLFEEGTIPEYTTPEWYATREHAPHLEQPGHRARLMTTATLVAQAVMHLKIRHRQTTVSDLGAGDGGLLSLLGPAIRAWGYDLMPANIEAAKIRGVDVELADALNGNPELGDIVVCTEMLEHLVDPHGFVRRLFEEERVRAFVCSSPADERPGTAYDYHTWAWDLEGYRAMLVAAGWVVKRQKFVNGFQILLAVKP